MLSKRDQQILSALWAARKQLDHAQEFAEFMVDPGLAEDLFMLSVELQRIYVSLDRPDGMRRYRCSSSCVSQTQLEIE